jgi:hypothetical protein
VRKGARLLALSGALGVGLFLFRASPRDVELVYDLRAPGATALEVEIRRGGELVRHAEFRVDGAERPIRHPVRLTDGDYVLAWRITARGGPVQGERPLEIREEGTVVLPLGP